MATLHEIASNGSPKEDKGASPFPGDSQARITVVYEFRHQCKLDSGAVEEAPCFGAKGGPPQIRRGEDDADEIFLWPASGASAMTTALG